jgi:hypothetical protein
MAHPYQDKINGRATAHKRYAEGGVADDENVAVKIARGVNTLKRMTGSAPNMGAVGVQQNADMVNAEKISDAVPRPGLNMEPARKSGGAVKKE